MKGLTDTTIRGRAGTMGRIAAFFGTTDPATLTEAQLTDWAESLGDLKRATRAVYISHARSFYAWAYDQRLIPADPAARLPVPRVPHRMPRPISETDLAFAFEWASPRVRAWLILGGWCGLRAKEVALLRGENIHLRDDPPYILVADTKGYEERIVHLSAPVVAELGALILPPRGPCWRTADGNPVPPNLVSKLCNRTLHDAGIPDTFHQLRHRFGTQVQRAGKDLRVTQELLGHKSPRATAAYAAVADADRFAAVRALPVPPPRLSPDAA